MIKLLDNSSFWVLLAIHMVPITLLPLLLVLTAVDNVPLPLLLLLESVYDCWFRLSIRLLAVGLLLPILGSFNLVLVGLILG